MNRSFLRVLVACFLTGVAACDSSNFSLTVSELQEKVPLLQQVSYQKSKNDKGSDVYNWVLSPGGEVFVIASPDSGKIKQVNVALPTKGDDAITFGYLVFTSIVSKLSRVEPEKVSDKLLDWSKTVKGSENRTIKIGRATVELAGHDEKGQLLYWVY